MVPLSYNLRNVRVRWQTSLLAIGGIALVVWVLIGLVAMSQGFRRTLVATGSDANAIALQKGSTSELLSGISTQKASFLMVDGAIRRDAQGMPLASPEMVVVASMKRRSDGTQSNVTVRGVTPVAFEVRREITLEGGRRFGAGQAELMVGRGIAARVAGLDLGGSVRMQRRDWRIVGIFSADGSGFESEIWGDANVLRQAFNRTGGYQSITLRLIDPRGLPGFAERIAVDPQLQLDVKGERKYYADQAGPTAMVLLILAAIVAVLMGIGAAFGVMITMYGIVAARTREIGTLRALGFSRVAILAGFLLESALVAFTGGLLGALAALPLNGLTAATSASFAEVAFAFRIDGLGLAVGIGFAAFMGLAGGLLPALRAARIPVTAALRDS